MKDHSNVIVVAVMIVAFIAGYSVVSYVVSKLKVSHLDATRGEQSQKGSIPITDNRSQEDDPFRGSGKT